jgi:hypothetical protein
MEKIPIFHEIPCFSIVFQGLPASLPDLPWKIYTRALIIPVKSG